MVKLVITSIFLILFLWCSPVFADTQAGLPLFAPLLEDDLNCTNAAADNDLLRRAGNRFGWNSTDEMLTLGSIASLSDMNATGVADTKIWKYDSASSKWKIGTDATGAGGSAIIFDIGDDGGNDSVDVSEIATTGDTNTIFSEPSADKILIAVGNNWPTADAATLATNFTCTDNENENLACPIVFVDGATGSQGAETDGDITYNPSTGVITATGFAGALTGNVTGDASGSSGSCTGLAATATALATTRAIGGVNFDGSAAITPTTIVVADTNDTTAYVGLWGSATGNLLPKTDAGITYNATSGELGITKLVVGPDSTPGGTFDDNDTTVETEDWKIYGNATDAGTGTEDVDIYLQTQINSVLTSVFHVDADGDFNILALDFNIATGKVYKINDVQIASGALGDVASIGMLDEAETIAENWVNEAHPWADNETANEQTITAQAGSTWAIADSVNTTSVFSGSTSLEETTAADDSGGCLVGIFDEFANSNSNNVQDVLDDLDAAIAGGGSGTMTTVEHGDVAVGGADIVTLDFLAADFIIGEDPNTEINISIDYPNGQVATTDVHGFLSDTDWDTFNNKQVAISGTDTHVMFFDGANTPAGEAGMTYNKTTDTLTVAVVIAALTGNVTGDTSGSSGSCTGNAATVTTNANLTGEVTSIGNAATIADSITVTGWTMGASAATTPGADDADTSLATTAFCETTQNYAKTSEITGNLASVNHHFTGTVIDPDGVYAIDHEVCIHPEISAAITITSIKITCDADPGTELDMDLKWADAFIGMASAAIIDVCDTTSGATSIVAGFDDATIASGKCIYWSFGAEPDAAMTQFSFDIIWDYD